MEKKEYLSEDFVRKYQQARGAVQYQPTVVAAQSNYAGQQRVIRQAPQTMEDCKEIIRQQMEQGSANLPIISFRFDSDPDEVQKK